MVVEPGGVALNVKGVCEAGLGVWEYLEPSEIGIGEGKCDVSLDASIQRVTIRLTERFRVK